jgi:hypothetical protein
MEYTSKGVARGDIFEMRMHEGKVSFGLNKLSLGVCFEDPDF